MIYAGRMLDALLWAVLLGAITYGVGRQTALAFLRGLGAFLLFFAAVGIGWAVITVLLS